jgi:heterodisulfide reductase subunit A-like polyferredoxin/coenzyme F420-reducing hydrogenase delta subunit
MIPLPEVQKIPKVLVFGNGPAARETAGQLLELGYEIIGINPTEDFSLEISCPTAKEGSVDEAVEKRETLGNHPRYTLYNQTALQALEGFAGEFQVHLKRDQKVWTETVGAIVLAPEMVSSGRFEDYGLKPSPQIMTLEELNFTLCSEAEGIRKDATKEERLKGLKAERYVAFLIGLKTEGNVLDMARSLSLAQEIRRNSGAQVCVFCRNVKVAEEGLERLYQACRDQGVLFFKFDEEGPELIRSGDGVTLHFMDTVLRQPFELTPDLLIIDSVHGLPEDLQALTVSARINRDGNGYLQPANIHLLPQASNRAGIFLAGPGKGPLLPRTCLEEARAAALMVHHFFQGEVFENQQREVTVDKGLCTICLTCLRFCPHQAIGWTHRIFIHPLACQRCGICASECPMDAIQIAGYADQDVEATLTSFRQKWEETEMSQPKVVAFGCQRSAGVAWEEVQRSTFKVQGQVDFISLPCAGKLDPDYVLKALAMGAYGVLVLACPEENCKSIHGNTYAHGRFEEIREYAEETGFDPGRIRFEYLSSNMVWKLKEVIDDFMGRLNESSN